MKRSGQGSTIDLWDVEKETQGEYFRNYNALIEYLETGPNGDLRAVARCIRPLLECNLRMRFPRSFKKGDWLGDMIGTIRLSSLSQPVNKLSSLAQELSDINDFSKHFHHDQNPNADSHTVNDTELNAYINRTIKVISGVLNTN